MNKLLAWAMSLFGQQPPAAPTAQVPTRYIPNDGQTPTPLAPPPPATPKKATPGKKTLASVVGVAAAAGLFVLVPAEESGRKVKVETTETGDLRPVHVSGKEYLTAYKDIVGVWTICDGDTKNVKPGMKVDRAECERRLEAQLIAHAEPVMKCVPGLKDRPNQIIASVSLAYNIGTTGYCRSTVARRFNAGDWKGGCEAFLMWNKAGGREVAGLTTRRKKERKLCLEGLN